MGEKNNEMFSTLMKERKLFAEEKGSLVKSSQVLKEKLEKVSKFLREQYNVCEDSKGSLKRNDDGMKEKSVEKSVVQKGGKAEEKEYLSQ